MGMKMKQSKIEHLEESVNNFEVLFHSTRDIVAVVDRHLNIVMINQAGIDTFGYTEKEIYNLKVEHFTEVDNGNIIWLLRKFKSSITFELDLYTKAGEVVNLFVKGKDITYKGKSARVIILTNITDIKKSQQNLVDLNRSLEERVA
ncbi:MAG TPA: PAS domain S-box protein, partial [Sulfurimonas sp.]|nr:PAS domain S-box protein [Sulfurimonas sp.]